MKSTAVCVVRAGKAEFGVLSKGIAVLARATRWLFARLFQGGEREADVKRDLLVGDVLLARHYAGCRADAQAAARGWRERLHEERQRLRHRLSQLETRRERDWRKPATRRRNAVATRKAETRLARVEKELQGRPKHCFGGRDLLRKGHLAAWRRRRDGNALFAGESGKKFGNKVARWDAGRLELKLPAGLGAAGTGGRAVRCKGGAGAEAAHRCRETGVVACEAAGEGQGTALRDLRGSGAGPRLGAGGWCGRRGREQGPSCRCGYIGGWEARRGWA